jgi:glutamate racemase
MTSERTKALRSDGRPIAVFDSGIGGLPYLETARSILPAESFAYLADRAGFPYGTKTREQVRDIVLGVVALLVRDLNPKALVIACNTASQAGLDAARRANPGLPIIGTVPAVKPAAERTRSGVIAVLASEGAVEDPYLATLIARYAGGVKVIRAAAQSLVAFVERRSAIASAEEKRAAVSPFVLPLVEEGADEIVLACTHFLHLREAIAEVAGPRVEVVDSRLGVVKRLRQVLGERGLLNAGSPLALPRELFFLTGGNPVEPEYGLLSEAFGLECPSLIVGG